MANKKLFNIPNNVDAEFEFFGINKKEFILFIPSLIISGVFVIMPIPIVAKALIPVVLLFIPYAGVKLPSVRPNVPVWKLAANKIKFNKSQKEYYYRKEGVKLVRFDESTKTKVNEGREITTKIRAKRKDVSTTTNPHQVNS